MSKKHKKNKWLNSAISSDSNSGGQVQHSVLNQAEVMEQRIIRTDLIRLLVINAVILGILLVLFYTNKSSGYLQTGLEKFLNLN